MLPKQLASKLIGTEMARHGLEATVPVETGSGLELHVYLDR